LDYPNQRLGFALKLIILWSMKVPTCILIALFSFLLVQPLLGTTGQTCEIKCSREAGNNCAGDDAGSEKNGCAKNQCNPLMSCSSGNFYIVEGFYLGNSPAGIKAKKDLSTDDNRILSSFSECWHPPELA
jgi:hypothetical protein